MKRDILPYLLHWLDNASRKPLVLRGARQVEKTWLVRHLSAMVGRQINEGGLAEQFVGQGLRWLLPFYVEPVLYYWMREKTGSSAEIDYLIQHDAHIIPIEVKAGKTGQLRSLHVLMNLRQWPLALRFNADYPSLVSVDNAYQLLSLPFYLVGQTLRLLSNLFLKR